MTQYWRFSSLLHSGTLSERLIVSLDLGGCREALRLVDELGRTVSMYRVGKRLFAHGGPEFLRQIRGRGKELFLDLKFHDTPRTVSRVALEATRLGVKMFDLHPYGSLETMQRTRTEVNKLCFNEGLRRPHILAVAMMAGVNRVASDENPGEHSSRQVVQLAKAAADASLDGVVVAPQLAAAVRAACGRRFIIVTSGARSERESEEPGGALSAADAVRAGADYLVVGSPIWNAPQPARAVREVLQQMERGLRSAQRSALALFSERQLPG